MEKTREYDQIVVDKISRLIKLGFLDSAKLILQIKTDNSNSIRITVENNPWRNGVVKGNSFFANIKSSGKNPYMNFKNSFAYSFRKIGIDCTANKTEQKAELIRISLPVFMENLNNPSDEFIKLINNVFLKNISFPEFGCCSKYTECEKAGKCLHSDQLYATACQYQKLLKRTGKFENP